MGLCIARQSERGEQYELISDTQNYLHKLLGYPDWATNPMLASIDRYGDTTFNRMQIGHFIAEWQTLFEKAQTREEQALLQSVAEILNVDPQRDSD